MLRGPAFSHNHSRRRLPPQTAPPRRPPTIVTTSPSGRITATGPGAKQAAATARHRRRVNLPIIKGVEHGLPTPAEALVSAYYQGVMPDYKKLANIYGEKFARATEDLYVKHLAQSENLGEPEDITHAIEAATVLTGIGGVIKGLGTLGAKELAGAGGKAAISAATKEAESAGVSKGASELLSKLKGVATQGVVRPGVKRAAQALEPEVVQAVRQAVARKAAAAAEKAPAAVRGAAGAAGRGAALPVQKPITSALAVQAPGALASGHPGSITQAFTPQGTLFSLSHLLGGYAGASLPGTLGQAANEAVNLPASVVPSVYLTGKAGVEAAQGHPEDLQKMWQYFVKTGLLPALAKGDTAAIKKALEDRPLYSALEASGGLSALGRGAGALARKTTNGRIGGRARPDLTVEGYPNIAVQRQYSPDLIRQALQRLADKRSGNEIRPNTGIKLPFLERSGNRKFRRAVVRDAGDRFNANAQDIQRLGRQQAEEVANTLLPRKKGMGRLKAVAPKLSLDKASADVVVHAIERIIQHPETFHADLEHRLRELNQIAEEKWLNGTHVLDKAELEANRAMAKRIEQALKTANPEHVVEAANAFIGAHAPIVHELVDRGVLSKEQAQKAALIPFARVHLGAGHGKPEALLEDLRTILPDAAEKAKKSAERLVIAKHNEEQIRGHRENGGGGVAVASHKQAKRQLAEARKQAKADEQNLRAIQKAIREHDKAQLLDRHGNPLTTDQLLAELDRRGIGAPGFISHRAETKGDYHKPVTQRDSLPKGQAGRRTGLAAERGTYDSSHQAVVRQLIRSRGLLDRVKIWDSFITRFGQDARGIRVKTAADAQKVVEAVKAGDTRYGLNPNIQWVAVRRQPFNAMKSEIDAALEHQDPTVAAEPLLHTALSKAIDTEGPGGDFVFMPADVVKNMEANFRPLDPFLKGLQLTTQGLKRAVLPFSPSYYFGNFFDNSIRTALAGVAPHHFIAGHKLSKALGEEKTTELTGAAFSAVEKLDAKRTHEDFTGTALQGIADSAAKFRAAPGPKQLVDLVKNVSRGMLAVNAKLTERLPQYGALGKIAMQDIRNVQGEWKAVIGLTPKMIEDLVKGAENPDTIIRWQKGIEDIYGNWSRMSPHARKFLTNFFPFWTWSRAALKLVYLTMPAHHPIQTALLTAAARMSQEERERLGLDLLGKEPLPNFLQGGVPIRGSISPFGKYTSFGYAGHPLESIATGVFPQGREQLAAAEGRDWKGEPLGGSELSHVGTMAEGAFGSFIPGFNTFQGIISNGLGYLSPVHVEAPGAIPYLRGLSESEVIHVPKKGSHSSSSGTDMSSVFGSGGSGGTDTSSVFGGS